MKTIIIDIDGICFDPAGRLNRCRNEDGTTNWKRAHSNDEVAQDPVIEGAAEATKKIWRQFDIYYLTDRRKTCYDATLDALWKNHFRDAPIEVRQYDDVRPELEMKAVRIKMLQEQGINLIAAIDDDGTLKSMYETSGVPCFTSFKDFFESEVCK